MPFREPANPRTLQGVGNLSDLVHYKGHHANRQRAHLLHATPGGADRRR